MTERLQPYAPSAEPSGSGAQGLRSGKPMERVWVFGDYASGKSTFARALGKALNLPVFHTDQLRYPKGYLERASDAYVAARIAQISEQPNWIIEGNVLVTDTAERVRRSDTIFLFDFSGTATLWNVLVRWFRCQFLHEHKVGCCAKYKLQLHPTYYLPHIFRTFPKRKAAALAEIYRNPQVTLTTFHTRKDVNRYLQRNLAGNR
mgnify:CR=1 FL=1